MVWSCRACIFMDNQLPVSSSLALEDMGDQESLGVNVCNLEGIDPQNREAWISGVRRTSQLQLTPGTDKLSAV